MGPGIGNGCNFQVGIHTLVKACGREEGVLFPSAEGESQRAEILSN